MYVQLVTLPIKPESASRFESLAKDNAAGSRREAGCIRFDVYRMTESSSFLLQEVFVDEEALEQHRQTEHYRRFMDGLPEMLDGNPSKLVLDTLDVA